MVSLFRFAPSSSPVPAPWGHDARRPLWPLLLAACVLAASPLTACGDSDDVTPGADSGADPDGSGGDAGGTDAGDPDSDTTSAELAIIGDYVDNFGGVHRVSQTVWISGWSPAAPTYAITQFDNDAQFLIAQNGADNTFSPDLYSRFDWAEADGKLYFCQSAFDAATEAAALAASADASDLAAGCGGFGWSELIEGQGPLAIEGEWVDNFDTAHFITSDQWDVGTSVHAITQYDNALRFVIAQNDADNEFSPGLWSRFDFTWDDANVVWYCQTAFGAADEAAALATTAADATDLEGAGCGGFPWSQLLEPSEEGSGEGSGGV